MDNRQNNILPPEILMDIFRYIVHNDRNCFLDIFSASLVCKSWYWWARSLFDATEVITHFFNHTNESRNYTRIYKLLDESHRLGIRDADVITGIHIDTHTDISNIIELARNMTSLNLRNIDLDIHADLSKITRVSINRGYPKFIAKLENVEELYIKRVCGVARMVPALEQLTKIKCATFHSLKFMQFERCITQWSELRSLHIVRPRDGCRAMMAAVGTCCAALEELVYSGSKVWDDQDNTMFLPIVQKCANLKKLTITHASNVTNMLVLAALQSRSLENLCIDACPDATIDGALEVDLSKCRIHTLKLDMDIDTIDLVHILGQCVHICHIEFCHTAGQSEILTEFGFGDFR
ncbi:hypothetical protein BC936DRAFT_148988 [Jimgerdemannia flammicorona]|uniref:F-box domain-containing protein n=1 Tax=Jimgerdemannia flammicorona TaxID=994334 RepID=A0A433D1U9_9FUNG|nr:hypothetical protein BC936DRAFT_148988 [Jimgerdemannia flammicorona]